MTRMDVARVVGCAFADAQRSYATHKRASRTLAAAYAADARAFLDAFLHALNRALVVFAREPAAERVIAFVARFAAERAPDAAPAGVSFSALVLTYLRDQCGAASKAVRFRACQTLAAALAALPEDAEVGEDLWDPLQEALLARACDKLPRVRAAAALALCRLQTSGEPDDDPVTAVLVALLTADSSAAVRKAALGAVAVNAATLPAIVRRTRDVKEDVRRAAYATLAARLHPEELELQFRVSLLHGGLRDRSAQVRVACAEELLVDGWLHGACSSNVFELVELLGGMECEDDVLLALRAIFSAPKRSDLLDAIQIDVNNLTPADVLVLRAMCDVRAAAKRLEEIVPSTLAYAEVLKYYSLDEFASRNLLCLCRRVDMSDEGGRRELESALRDYFLTSSEVGEGVIPNAVSAMRSVMITEDAASRALVEIILNEILPSSGQALTSDGVAVVDTEAESSNEKMEDDWASMRALGIAKELLRHSTPAATLAETGNGLFPSLMQQVVIPRLTSPDGGQRHASLECLALFCLLDKTGNEAKRHLPLFVQACRNDNEDIQDLAVRSLADLFLVFDFAADDDSPRGLARGCKGSTAKTPTPETSVATPAPADRSRNVDGEEDESDIDEDEFFSASGDSPASRPAASPQPRTASVEDFPAVQVVALLTDYVTHIDENLRTAATEALSRLLFCRRVTPTAKLLSRLLIAYHNPVNAENEKLQQCLSVFFSAFAFSAPHHRLALESAFLPTLQILRDAPSKSPLKAISPLTLAQFVLHLTNPSSIPGSQEQTTDRRKTVSSDIADAASSTHERIAEALLNYVLDVDEESETDTVRLFSKILASIRFAATVDNIDSLARLRKLSAVAVDTLQDRQSVAQIRRFEKHVSSVADHGEEMLAKLSSGDSNSIADPATAAAGGSQASEHQGAEQRDFSSARPNRDVGEQEAAQEQSSTSQHSQLEDGKELPKEEEGDKPRRRGRKPQKEARRKPPAKQRRPRGASGRRAPLVEKTINVTDDEASGSDEPETAPVPQRKLPRRSTRSRRSYAEPEIVSDWVTLDVEPEDVIDVEDDDDSDASYVGER